MALPQFKNDDTQTPETPIETTSGFDDIPRRLPKSVKWLAGTAIGLALLAGAAGLVATQVIDQQKYKSMVVSKVEEATGYTIDWNGNINLGLMPLPHASVNELSIKSGQQTILSIAKADVQVALSPLLSKKIEIKNVSLDSPVVTLVTTKNGNQTWMAKPKSGDTTAASDEQPSSPDAEKPMDISVDKIQINNGQLIVDNQQSGSKQQLDDLNLTLRADSLSGPFDITGDTVWSGQKIELKATSGEINSAEGSYPIQASLMASQSGAKLGFSGTVDSKNKAADGDVNIEIDDVAKAAKGFTGSSPDLPKGLDGKALIAGKLMYSSTRVALDDMSMSLGAIGYSGAMAVDGLGDNSQPQLSINLNPKAKAGNDAAPLVQLLSDLKIAAKASVEGDKIQIATANVQTQGNNITVNGVVGTGANKDIDIAVNADEINLDVLQKKLAGGGDSSSSGDNAATSSKKDAASMGFSVPFTGRVRADVAKLTTGGKTYQAIKADIVSRNGSLMISNASVNLPDNTSIDVKGSIGKTQSLSDMDLTVRAQTPDADKLITTYVATPPELPSKIGAAGLNGHFTGDLQNLGFGATISAMQFNVTGAGTVADPVGTPVINALKFTIKHPNFNDAMRKLQPGFSGSSGFAGALDVSGDVNWGTDTYNVSNLNGKLGQTTIAGNISASTKPKMSMSGALNLGNIVLPSATNSGASNAGTVQATPSSGKGDRWSRDTIDTAWMKSFDADLKIKAKSITQNMWKLTDANFAFKLNNGVLNIDDVSAGLFGGNASINGTIKSGAGNKDPLTLNMNMKANNVDAAGLISAATGKISHTLTGTISGVDVSINATGASPAALVQTLGGKGTANGKNIIVQGVDAAQLAATAKGSYKPLERAGSLFQTFQSGSTEFSDFNSEFAIQNGIVNFSKIYFDGPKATLNSTGNVNLPAWTVDLKNTMTVKDTDIPPFDFSIRGPLDNPINSGGDIINNYLQNKLQKKAAKLIEDKLGKLLGVPSNAPAPAEPATDGSVAPAPQPTAKEQAAQEAVKALQGLFGK